MSNTNIVPIIRNVENESTENLLWFISSKVSNCDTGEPPAEIQCHECDTWVNIDVPHERDAAIVLNEIKAAVGELDIRLRRMRQVQK